MPPIKKVVGWVVLAFLVYAVFTNPTAAAGVVRNVWDILVTGVANIGAFFNSLLGRG